MWSVLPRDVLQQRIVEEQKRKNLTFAERQTLEAAREHLISWPSESMPKRGRRRG